MTTKVDPMGIKKLETSMPWMMKEITGKKKPRRRTRVTMKKIRGTNIVTMKKYRRK